MSAGQQTVAPRFYGRIAGTSPPAREESLMLIDCDTCAVRGLACDECVVSVLLDGPPDAVDLDAEERRALHVLADGGLVPRLRLVARDGGSVDGRQAG